MKCEALKNGNSESWKMDVSKLESSGFVWKMSASRFFMICCEDGHREMMEIDLKNAKYHGYQFHIYQNK